MHHWMSLHAGSESCADPVCVKVTQYFSLLSSCKVFLKQNNSINHFHCQRKKDIHMGICCCCFRQRQGVGVTQWQLPTGCFITISQPSLSCRQRMCRPQHRPGAHAAFCVHSTSVQAWACLGQCLCETLTALGAMVSWSGSQCMCACISGLHLHIKPAFVLQTELVNSIKICIH